MGIHAKLDDLQQREWARLLEIQDRQIAALARIEHALAARLDSND
jgi:succinate dehydrogenase flavin-adding protein (antitoxin of CptAB toxin-antitoxin module)